MATATPRSSYNPSNPYNSVANTADGALKWMTWEVKNDPSYKLDTAQFHVENGNVVENQPGFLLRNPWLIPAIGIGAGFGLGLATLPAAAPGAGVAGAGAGAGGAGGAGAADVTGLGPVAVGGGTTAATVPPALSNAGLSAAGGSTASPSLFSSLIGPLISGVSNIFGANAQASANVDAAKIQAAEYDKALAQAKAIYDQQQQNLAPYRGLGAGAVGNLAYGLGITMPSSGSSTPTTPTTPSTPTPPTFPDLVNAGNQQVNMKNVMNQTLNRQQQVELQYGMPVTGLTQSQIDAMKNVGIDLTQPLNSRQIGVLFGPTSMPSQSAQDQYNQQLNAQAQANRQRLGVSGSMGPLTPAQQLNQSNPSNTSST